ncbi:hypothetical protein [Planctomyces sp. SH-PL14]|uniref:hypothetical protein n=1 Tax=Planctomyces sp. SH-PL14 TaxID=1632864 RepID=UPI00078E48DA|nr:hypothetical protein [Planctomyces sp. SH-PL14]AMV18899.1 hypothetical protein VT03_13500 [Planctomyces sp. SH-PL14]
MPLLSTEAPESPARTDVDAWLCQEDALVCGMDHPASIEAREGYLRGIRAAADATWHDGITQKEWRRRTREEYFRTNPVVCLIVKWMIGRLIAWAIDKLLELYTRQPRFAPHHG